MTIKPGEDWGTRQALPGDALAASSDAELTRLLVAGETRPIVLRGGDLHRTLGSPALAGTALLLPIDLLRVTADGTELTAVAHVVARARGRLGWWRGPIVAVMNAEFLGRWDVAPRAHPNDGHFDTFTVDAAMPLRTRWQVWRRLPAGNHLPHPGIAARRGADEAFEFERPLTLWLDGVRTRSVRTLHVTTVPDGALVYV